MTLKETIQQAEGKKVAIGHFNISNLEMVWGIFNAAKNLNVPVIIGVSEGERKFVGVRQIVAVVKSIREEYDFPIFLNADHSYSFDTVKEAIDAGFDMAIIDGAKLSFEENVKVTKQCVDYARKSGKEILIEGELGYIGQSSKVLDAIPEGVDLEKGLTTPEQAAQFVKETGVDLFAPAVGNIHGMLRASKDPHLDIERTKNIRVAAGVSLVLHGGSGTPDEDFVKAIDAGVSIVHISTELRVAYRNALSIALQDNPEEVAPYKYLKEPVRAVEKVVTERLKLFNKIS
ncbi:MAG TPA: class II fructose-bisphosphate aldolase [Candidatus Paceibacterota bacterium]